jgi:Putative Actinobacterial Holin-X, holin superfamily III
MQRKEERSLGDLFSQLTHDLSTLLRQEVMLAKTELSQKASKAGKDVGFLAVGGALAYAGFLVILAGVVLALGLVLPWWASALIVGVVVAAIGYFLIRKGQTALKQADLTPKQTIETLKEDQQWAKEQV